MSDSECDSDNKFGLQIISWFIHFIVTNYEKRLLKLFDVGIKVSPSPCKRVPEKILSPEKAFVSYSYMELRLPEKLGWKPPTGQLVPRFSKWWKITRSHNFKSGFKIKMSTIYVLVKRKIW